MAPCAKPKTKGKGKPNSKATKKDANGKKSHRHANMFILFYLETYRRCGGNMYCVAKECGKKWKTMSQAEKDKYKRMYCAKCKNCKSCKKPTGGSKKAGAGAGGKGKGKKC